MCFGRSYLWLGGNDEFRIHGKKGLSTEVIDLPSIQCDQFFWCGPMFLRDFFEGQFAGGFEQTVASWQLGS